MNFNKRFIFFTLCIILTGKAFSQSSVPQGDGQEPGFFAKNFQLSGEAGVYGELYKTNSSYSYRPSSSGRIYLRPSFNLFNTFSTSFDLLLSTEGNSAKQNINQIGLNPSWSWGTAHLGDLNQSFSDLTLNGILVRGAGIEINPGVFRFAAVGGYTKRAVSGGAEDGSFDRVLYGAKIGIGKEQGSYFDLMFVRTKDEISSLPKPKSSITVTAPNGDDVWPIGSEQTITWSSSKLAGNVKIELSTDGGATFKSILDATPNDGYETIIVNALPTAQALIKITSLADSVSDISDHVFTIGGTDSKVGNIQAQVVNSSSVTPQENLVVGAKSQLALLDNTVVWKWEFSGSAFTRDMEADEFKSDKIPSFVTNLFTPRLSTSVSYAGATSLNIELSKFNAKAGFRYISPGYTSLGLASSPADEQEFLLGAGYKLNMFNIYLEDSRQNDNLLAQKLYTTVRNRFSATVNSRVTNQWNMSLMGNYISMSNNSNNDTTGLNFSTLVLSMNHMLVFSPTSFVQSANINYVFQSSGDKSDLRKNMESESHSLNVNAYMNVTDDFSLSPVLGFINSKMGDMDAVLMQNYYLTGIYRLFENKLMSTLSLGASVVSGTTTARVSLSASYQLTSADMVSLMVSNTNFSASTNSYNETMATLNISHRF